jgi:replicative DNA helicase
VAARAARHPDDPPEPPDDPQPRRGRGANLPVDEVAERSVLAALLNSPLSFDDVADRLHPDDFAGRGHADIYRAIISCDAGGRPIDEVTIVDELRRAKALTRVGGVEGIRRLTDTASNMMNVVAHADIVAAKSQLRRVWNAGREMATAALEPSADHGQVRELAESLVFNLGRERGNATLMPMAEAIPKALAELHSARSKLLLGHSTGFPDLDRLTAGLQGGQLIILAARPAVGKSAFALQLASHVARVTGQVVPFCSFEMSSSELTVRLLSNQTGIPLQELSAGRIPPGMDGELQRQAGEMSHLSLWVDDQPPQTISGMKSTMRKLARNGELGMVVIDYLQLMEGERRGRGFDENRTTEVSEISRGLKRLAVELNVPIVALSQLSRALESRQNKRPMLSDLRESGSLEQDANTVMFLHRESVWSQNADPTECELIIAKQRNGPTGTVMLHYEGPCVRFSPSTRPVPVIQQAGPGGGGRQGGGGGGAGRTYF